VEYRKLGRFHIERSVAKGGMGEVVRSVDDAGNPIALKTILDAYREDKRFQDLFIREAEITFQLNHPNIVKAFRFEKLGNRLVLALEYLDGVTLKDVLRKAYDENFKIPLSLVYAILTRVLEGLQYAHSKTDHDGLPLHIVHRDLNPSNIFLTYAGEVKILDFGISKANSLELHQLTPKNELRGKVCYLAPEQLSKQETSHLSDIFSLGIVMWESITGRPLYVRETDAEVMEAITDGKYEKISQYRKSVPEEVEAIVKKALSFNPKNRYQNCREFKNELDRVFAKVCLPGVSEEDLSIFVRALFRASEYKNDQQFLSGYAWLLSQMDGHEKKALGLATEIASKNPTRPMIQLNYARTLLLRGDRIEALRLLRRLARVDSLEEDVQNILVWLGVRRKPVISFLPRANPVNYVLGRFRHRILGPTPYQEQFLAA